MKKYLINPFQYIAGWSSLAIGLVILLILSVLGYIGGVHFDGAIDVHVGDETRFLNYIIENIIDWLSISLFLYLSGIIASKTKFRIIDILGTVATSRVPLILTVISCFFLPTDTIEDISHLKNGSYAILIVFSAIAFLTLAWMFILLYNAFTISCNIKGSKAIILLILSIVLAEVLSSIILNYLPI